MDEVFGLFPIPFMRARSAIPLALVGRLVEELGGMAQQTNNSSGNLSHSEMLRPQDSPLLAQLAELVAPKLADFGVHLLGERLPWIVKEMWVNVLETGGRQAMHNHANSFVSCVVYLTP